MCALLFWRVGSLNTWVQDAVLSAQFQGSGSDKNLDQKWQQRFHLSGYLSLKPSESSASHSVILLVRSSNYAGKSCAAGIEKKVTNPSWGRFCSDIWAGSEGWQRTWWIWWSVEEGTSHLQLQIAIKDVPLFGGGSYLGFIPFFPYSWLS